MKMGPRTLDVVQRRTAVLSSVGSFAFRCILLIFVSCLPMVCLSQVATNKCSIPLAGSLPQVVSQGDFEKEFNTPLLRAIALRRPGEVQDLLSNGADPNGMAQGDYSKTPLLLATALGEVETVKILLDAGANIEAKNDLGMTALIIAVLRKDLKTAEFLLSREAKANGRTDAGATALMSAAEAGSISVVRLLLKANADPNLATECGVTALMGAADDPEVIEALVKAGANTEAKDAHGRTAVCYAKEDNQPRKLASLLRAGAAPCPKSENPRDNLVTPGNTPGRTRPSALLPGSQ